MLAGLVGGAAAVVGGWLARHQEERRALTEFAIKTAIDNWRQVAERADMLKMPRHDYGLSPMDGYLTRTLALVQILQRRKFSPADIHERLAELEAVGQVLKEHLEKKRNEQKPATPV